jgi:hypothetical protein
VGSPSFVFSETTLNDGLTSCGAWKAELGAEGEQNKRLIELFFFQDACIRRTIYPVNWFWMGCFSITHLPSSADVSTTTGENHHQQMFIGLEGGFR